MESRVLLWCGHSFIADYGGIYHAADVCCTGEQHAPAGLTKLSVSTTYTAATAVPVNS